jgi:hypothetical protein
MTKLPFYLSLFLGLLFLGCQKDNAMQEAVAPERPALDMNYFDGKSILPNSEQESDLTSRSIEFSTATVFDFFDPDNPNPVGSSTLLRKDDRLSMSLKTNALPAGHVATVWWVIFNNPEFCEGTPCGSADFDNPLVQADALFAAGKKVPEARRPGHGGHHGHGGHFGNGRKPVTKFVGQLRPGETDRSIFTELFGIPGIGVIDPQKAEVHLVVRSHGPKLPGQVLEQMSTYLGGCTTELPGFTEMPDAPGECADVFAAIHIAP